MLSNFFTLRALADEWSLWLPGCVIEESYSQTKGELTISLRSPSRETCSLRISTRSPYRYMFCHDGQNRARKNTRSIIDDITGNRIECVSIADGDRQIEISLESGWIIRIDLFGPGANVYLLRPDGCVHDRFRSVGTAVGKVPAAPRSKNFPDSESVLEEGIRRESGTLEKRIQRVISVFDRKLAHELVFRFDAGMIGEDPPDALDYAGLYEAVTEFRGELHHAAPRIYEDNDCAVAISVVRMHSLERYSEETFPSVNAAVHSYVRRLLSRSSFDSQFRPLQSALSNYLAKSSRRLQRMRLELSRPGRADTYELFGHLLMAAQHDVPPGKDRVTLPDIIEQSGEVTIKLDARVGAVQNAEKYYAKARNTRQARASSTRRVQAASITVKRLEKLILLLETTKTLDDIKRFKKEHATELAGLIPSGRKGQKSTGFRRFELTDGFQVWVGRSASQNDELTTRVARKYDYWLHARGVAGSHVLLRLPSRDVRPPKYILEQAASIAAYFSKARTSSLVPVIYTQKKYVRKPRKSLPGAVVVEREKVMMVEPILPTQKSERL